MTTKKSRWRTVRCVVEYRTDSDMSERDLARHVQGKVNELAASGVLRDSQPWAKAFNQVLGKMEGARPRKLRSITKALDAAVERLKKV